MAKDTSVGAGQGNGSTTLPAHAPDELIVQFAPGIGGRERAELAQSLGGREQETIHTQAMQAAGQGVLSVVKLPPGLDLDRAIAIVEKRPGVLSVDRDWELSLDATSNDPGYTDGQLWGMRGDATSPANAFGTGAAEAYTGSSKVVAGVVDSGIDYRHPDLYLNVWLNQGEIPDALKAALRDVDADGLITFRDPNARENAGGVSDLNGNARVDAGDLLADAR